MQRWKRLLGPGIAVIVGLLAFAVVILPVHQSQAELKDYGGVERSAEGQSYIWTKPDTVFRFFDLPRFAPFYLTLRMSLDRIEGAPPAHVELIERQGQSERSLATYEYSPQHTGFADYVVKISPPEKSLDSFVVLVKSNEFRAPGDTRELGVRLESLQLRLSPANLLSALLFPRPYALAVLLLLLGMATWCYVLEFGPLETGLSLATVGISSGILANLLAQHSWLLVLLGLLIWACAYWWTRPARRWPWVPLAVALSVFSFWFVLVPGLPGDIYYWRQVLEPIMTYGPIGVYPHAPRLVYPPGSVFFLWFYGLLAQPFGLIYTQAGLKALMGLAHFGLLGAVWYTGERSGIATAERARAVWLLGFSLSLVFVPVSWVQADGWLVLMMVLPLLLVAWKRPYTSATVQALGILYKGQSWLLLPLYALTYQWRFGWRRALAGGGLTLGLVGLVGGLGFAFDPAIFRIFWEQPVVSGESAWGGIRSFNLLHALGYDQKQVPQPLLGISYGLVALGYLAILFVTGLRNRRKTLANSKISDQADLSDSLNRQLLPDWLLAAGLFFTLIFFLWVKMHERYLYFGLAFLPFVALWRRDMYKPIAVFNLLFMLNLLYAYLPERRDPIPNNFLLWRHALKMVWVQNSLVVAGLLACVWLAWLYFRPTRSDKTNLVTAELPQEQASVVS